MLQSTWFNNDGKSIVGGCSCRKDLVWDNNKSKCLSPGLTGVVIVAIVIGIIAVIVMLIIAACVFKRCFRK